MARNFSSVDLVQLPLVDSHGAVALASVIEAAAAKFNDLPQNVVETIVQIVTDRAILQQAIAKAPGAVVTVKEADRRMDKVGVAFHDILAAWASLQEFLPQGKTAQILLDRLFSEGRTFVNLKVKEEWAAIETKIATVEREGLAGPIGDVGATPVFTLLRDTHALYGQVVGTTDVPGEVPEVRESRHALLDSIRDYVLQVAATVKRNKPETGTRAEALLKPVREWESTRPAKEKVEAGAGSSGP